MPINILMPALSPTMEKGNLAKWLKKEGDAIKSGDVIAEIETDKATMEVEAVDEGVLAKIVVPDGTQDVPVNELIAVIAGEGEDAQAPSAERRAPKAAAAAAASRQPRRPPLQPPAAAAAAAAPARRRASGAAATATRASSPRRSRGASRRKPGIDLVADRRAPARMAASSSATCAPRSQAAAPRRAARLRSAPPQPLAPAAAPAAPRHVGRRRSRKFFEPGSFEEVPHDTMRKVIARRLLEAKQTIPHFYLSIDCELDALLALREQINAAAPKDKDGKPAYKVSVNDFVIKALALALRACRRPTSRGPKARC